MSNDLQEKLAHIRLNTSVSLSFSQYTQIRKDFGSLHNFLLQTPQTISVTLGFPLDKTLCLLQQCTKINPEEELAQTTQLGGTIYTPLDREYPSNFLSLKHIPLAIYILGNLPLKNQVGIGLVGTRKVTPYGKRVTAQLATGIVKAGAIIISGLARGVDSIGHAIAVREKAPTIACIGTGLGRCYPPENKHLSSEIVKNGGTIISEFSFNDSPLPFHFPQRNRLIAALSQTVVVVEGELKSGALITAKLALEMGKDVLAVPGPIDSPFSAGPNQLIKQGAGVVTTCEDIIDSLPLTQRSLLNLTALSSVSRIKNVQLSDLPPFEREVMQAIGTEQKSLDQLASTLHRSVPDIATVLFSLEIKNLLICENGLYAKKRC